MENNAYLVRILLVCGLLVGLTFLPGRTLAVDAADDMLITLDFQDVELVDMISTISELTGKNFLFDESVRGKVSILSPEPVSLDEAYRLFLTVLRVRGFAVVPSGKVNKIVALASVKEETLPITDERGLGDQLVTRILELRHLDVAAAVETILRPLMPRTSHVVAHQASNTIVITDTAENIERLHRLLKSLDRTWDQERIELVSLQYAEAVDTAALAMQILEGDGSAAPAARERQAQPARRRIAGQIIPYERTNTLALQGEQRFINQAKELIAKLDVEVEASFSGVHVYYLENAEAEPLAETINQIVAGAGEAQSGSRSEGQEYTDLFKNVKVTADKPTNSLIINASQDEFRNVMSLIGQLDIKRKQVFVEALIMELSMDAVLELGTSLQGAVDLGSDSIISAASGASTASGGTGATGPPIGLTGPSMNVLSQAVQGIMLGGLFNPITTIINGETVTIPAVSALINLSQTDSDVNVLSAPRLLTSDNEEAEIIVGENVPIITSRASSSTGDGPNIISAVERQDAALILRFTPQITAGGLVRMKIHQEISGVKSENADIGPTLTKTLLRNSIVARDGETVVLGGLFKNQTTKKVTKVPLLGDIPVLGWLFKSTSDDEQKRSLLIFITPRVLSDTDDLSQLTRDSHKDLQLFHSEGGTDAFFDQQRMKTFGDFSVPLEN
ncbi:MAG: type II secretion system secretin GspD [Pelovirga sp.]